MNTSIRANSVAACLLFTLGASLPVGAFAQTAASIDDPAVPSETAAVELPPFEVRTDQDEGYMAQNTASGSRLNTSLKDTPAPISVFTEEFLRDIGATDISELADYTSSTERLNGLQGDVAGGNEFAGGTAVLRVRGLTSTRMVNFFARGTEVDTYNTERIELARGGNSLLFGPGSGGGVFNVSTKKADLRRSRHAVSYRFGDFDQSRTTVDFNVPIVSGVVALRVNALKDSTGSWRPHEGRDSERLALAGRWQVTPRLLLNVEHEINNIRSSRHRLWGTYDSFTDWNNAGRNVDPKAAAPGETLAQTRARLGIATIAANSQFWVYDSTLGQLINYGGTTAPNIQSRSANTIAPVAAPGSTTPGSGPQENPMLLDFSVVPKGIAVYGDGIGNITDEDVTTATLIFEPLKGLYLEVAYNHQESLARTWDSTEFARIQWDTSPTTVTGAPNPHLLEPYIEMTPLHRISHSNSDDLRITASYEAELGRWFGRHRLAAAFERLDAEQAGASHLRKLVVNPANPASADHANNTVRYRTYVDLAGPRENIAVFDFRQDPSGRTAWVPANGINDTRRVTDTMMAAAQSYFWNDRVVTTYGYRKDYIDSYDSTTARTGSTYNGVFTQGDLVATRNATARENAGITRNIGGVFHATRWLSLFANRGSTFGLPNANNRIERDTPAPQTEGESRDYGLKLSLFDGRVFGTVTYFETASRQDTGALNANISRDLVNTIWDSLNTVMPGDPGGVAPLAARNIDIDTVRSSVNAFTFDSRSQGWEYEIVANPSRNLRLSFGYSDRVTKRTNSAKELFAYLDAHRPLWAEYATRNANGQTIAARVAAIDADHAIRLVLPEGRQQLGTSRYTARFRGNYSFREGRLKGFGLGGGLRWNSKAIVGYDDANRELYAKRYAILDANATYRTRASLFQRKLDLEFQLNASNLLDEDDIVVTRLYTNSDIRTYEYQLPRQVYLTTTVRF